MSCYRPVFGEVDSSVVYRTCQTTQLAQKVFVGRLVARKVSVILRLHHLLSTQDTTTMSPTVGLNYCIYIHLCSHKLQLQYNKLKKNKGKSDTQRVKKHNLSNAYYIWRRGVVVSGVRQ